MESTRKWNGTKELPKLHLAHFSSSHSANGSRPAYSVLSGGGGQQHGGSNLSLASNGTQSSHAMSNNTTSEELYKHEIRKLQQEVDKYRDKVNNLTAQQQTYTSMVQAFERALQGMVKRVETLQV